MKFFGRKSLINLQEINKFIDLYARKDNWHNIDKRTGNLGYAWIHYSLIRILQPKRVLVIGSQFGYIPAICAIACRDNGKGIVDFVDAGYDYRNPDDKAHWGGKGFWKKNIVKKHFGKFGLEKYIILHIMTTQEFSKKISDRKWNYIYLDGDHSYKGIAFDFESFWPHLEKNGFVCLHDIYTRDFGDLECGVNKFWKKIKKKFSYSIELGGNCGLGIIQKI